MEDLAQPLTQNKKPFSPPATVGLPDIWSFIPKMAPVVGHGFLKSGPDTRILWQTAGGGSSSKGLFRKGRGIRNGLRPGGQKDAASGSGCLLCCICAVLIVNRFHQFVNWTSCWSACSRADAWAAWALGSHHVGRIGFQAIIGRAVFRAKKPCC